MGLYANHILPFLIDVSMRKERVARLRRGWIPRARGEVLEIGIGSGLNLPYYSAEVSRVRGIDPSIELQRRARSRVAAARFPVDFHEQPADRPFPFPGESFDTVVVTFALCSIADASAALREMARVLRPDGSLLFIEHGRAPDARIACWQDRLTPCWKRFAGGCHLNRKVDGLIAAAGFRITELQAGYLPGPRFTTFIYQGCALPPSSVANPPAASRSTS